MHGFTPDQVGAFVGGVIVMLGALVGVIAKAWQALHEIRDQTDVAVRQTGGNGENAARIAAQQAADTVAEVRDVLADVRAEQQEQTRELARQGDRLHAVETGVGGLRDDVRQVRVEGGQTRAELAGLRTSAEDTHRDLNDGQDRLGRRLDCIEQHTTDPT